MMEEWPVEHDAEKACPGLDPGWIPVFAKDHAELERDDVQGTVISL
jgi:hypothetical protein